MTPSYHDETLTLFTGDCLEVMPTLEAGSVDAVVTDPPYGLEFMGKEWDRLGADLRQPFRGEVQTPDNPYGRTPVRYPYGADPRSMQAWHERWAREAFRLLKPGGHLLAFGGTRTYHRLASAIEDAGFEIRDCLVWAYASGFPKSLDVGKAIDKRPGVSLHERFAQHLVERRETKGLSRADVSEAVVGTRSGACWNWEHHQFPEYKWWTKLRDLLDLDPSWEPTVANAEREVLGKVVHARSGGEDWAKRPGSVASPREADVTAPATDDAKRWDGWGTALKPAWEPIVMARKPLQGTVAANVLRHGTGALNIDGARIGAEVETWPTSRRQYDVSGIQPGGGNGGHTDPTGAAPAGRWPANVVLTDPIFDGDTPGVVGGGETGLSSGGFAESTGRFGGNGIYGAAAGQATPPGYGDTGTYSRFFLIPKEARAGREPAVRGQLDGKLDPKIARRGRCIECGRWMDAGESICTCGGSFEYESNGPRRRENSHPTVKPLELMRHLVRLVTPPGGLVIDPFLGSGTTALAAVREGFRCIGIEREAEYMAITMARLHGTQVGIGL